MKSRYKKDYYPVIAVVFLRLVFQTLIFFKPFISSIFVFFLDWVDGEVFKRSNFTKSEYQLSDKLLDFYWYLLIIIFLFINHSANFSLFLFFFLFRSVGQILFFLTKKEIFLFFFPNIFEILFYIYLFSVFLPHPGKLFAVPDIYYLLLIISPLVLFREYIIHIRKSNLSWFFTGKTTYWLKE